MDRRDFLKLCGSAVTRGRWKTQAPLPIFHM